MKTLLTFFLLTIVLFSCSKDSNTSSGKIKSPFTVKYEIVTSNPVLANPAITDIPYVGYRNSTLQLEIDYSFRSGSTWTKSFTITETRRPLTVEFATLLYMTTAGQVTCSIYLNGEKKATSTNPTVTNGGITVGNGSASYIIE